MRKIFVVLAVVLLASACGIDPEIKAAHDAKYFSSEDVTEEDGIISTQRKMSGNITVTKIEIEGVDCIAVDHYKSGAVSLSCDWEKEEGTDNLG